MGKSGEISVRLLKMLSSGEGLIAKPPWGPQVVFLGFRATMAIKDDVITPPENREIVEVTGMAKRSVRKHLRLLEVLGMLKPGIIDDPRGLRKENEKFYAQFDMDKVRIALMSGPPRAPGKKAKRPRKGLSSQLAMCYVHVLSFLRPTKPEVPVNNLFRSTMANQMGMLWDPIRDLITRLRDLHLIRERTPRKRKRVSFLSRWETKIPAEAEPEEEVEVEPEEKEAEATATDEAAAFDDLPLSEMYGQINRLSGGNVEEIRARNALIQRYNERVLQLKGVLGFLQCGNPDVVARIEQRFQEYSPAERTKLDSYESGTAAKADLGRELTDKEKRFYMRRLDYCRVAPLIAIEIVGTYGGADEAEPAEEKPSFELTREQVTRWDSFLLETWKGCYNRLMAPKQAKTSIDIRRAVIALRDTFLRYKEPLWDDKRESDLKKYLTMVIEEAGRDAQTNPRAKKIRFTPGWVMTFYIQQREAT